MTLIVSITDKNGKQIVREKHDNDSEFYLGAIDKDGQYKSFGRLPSRKIFLNSIHESAREWAKEQDLHTYFQELRQMLIQESIKTDNLQAQLYLQADEFFFDADELLKSFTPFKQEIANDFKAKCGKEGGIIFFHVTWEYMLAMIDRLRQKSRRVCSVWEYPASVLGKNEVESILEWLFRRVENDRNN